MRWTRKPGPPVGLAARISFTPAPRRGRGPLPSTGRDGRPSEQVCSTSAALPQLPYDPRTKPSSPPAVDGKRRRVCEHGRASARVAEGEAARGLRDTRHCRSRARTGSKIRMRAARLATHRGRLHHPTRLRVQRQPLRARGFRRSLPRRLPRVASGALSQTRVSSTTTLLVLDASRRAASVIGGGSSRP
jgi:hypothetical protein